MSDNENLEPEVEDNASLDDGVVGESHLDDGNGVESNESIEFESAEGETAIEPAADKTPGWEPNYNYRYGDDEYEMDERVKALIKDPETNEFVRDMVERAHGVDLLKEQRQHLREEVGQLKHIESQRQNAVNQMTQLLQQGDIRAFTKAWGITPEQVRQLAFEDMRVQEMPPEDRAAYDRQQQVQEQAWALQQQNQQLQQRYNHMAVNQREGELQNVLHNERYSTAAQSFDERAGRPGAFREEIIKRGQYYAQVHQKDVPPNILADELLTYVGQPQPTQSQGGYAQPQAKKPVMQVQQKPTLPQIRGNSGSPIKSKVRSIADLKKLASELAI